MCHGPPGAGGGLAVPFGKVPRLEWLTGQRLGQGLHFKASSGFWAGRDDAGWRGSGSNGPFFGAQFLFSRVRVPLCMDVVFDATSLSALTASPSRRAHARMPRVSARILWNRRERVVRVGSSSNLVDRLQSSNGFASSGPTSGPAHGYTLKATDRCEFLVLLA